jgi:hypothetical protein
MTCTDYEQNIVIRTIRLHVLISTRSNKESGNNYFLYSCSSTRMEHEMKAMTLRDPMLLYRRQSRFYTVSELGL